MTRTIEFFPDGYIALNAELATGLHPKLEKFLSEQPVDEVDLKLSIIAHYCAILLDGTYTLEARDKLCHILVGRLQVLREIGVPQEIISIDKPPSSLLIQ